VIVFLDTNVILDVALRRPNLFEGSRRALEKCQDEGHETRCSWHTVSNLFYILRRDRGAAKSVEFIGDLLKMTVVASVGHQDALRAVNFGLNDFEDAMQLAAAEGCSADVILTRNTADFGRAPSVRVLTPEEFAPLP
jgi:predicted nucleic acid-binding protein